MRARALRRRGRRGACAAGALIASFTVAASLTGASALAPVGNAGAASLPVDRVSARTPSGDAGVDVKRVISTVGRRGVEHADRPSEYFGAWKSAVAFDGTNYLVAWTDQSGFTAGRVYAARVSPEGAVLDPSGILIASAAGVEQPPAIAFDGTNYLVAWADSRAGCCSIYGARVSPSGSVLDPNGIAISSASNGYSPALAFDGTNYLVVWEGGARLSGARVTPAGTVLDRFAISAGPGSQGSPVLAFDGMNYLVAWSDCRPPTCVEPSFYRDIYGTRVTPGGTVLDPQGIPISTQFSDERQPAISFDGTNYLLAWVSGISDDSRINGARVTPAGNVLDPSGIAIATTPFKGSPTLAFDGTNYLVAWEYYAAGDSQIYGARVTPAGTVLDPDGNPISTAPYAQSRPALAFDGTNYMVAWADNRSSTEYEIFGTRVSQAGAVLDPDGIQISPPANDECAPALAFDGTNYLVTWQQRSGRDWNLYGARVTPEGTVLDPEAIPISIAPGDQRSPVVAFDGTNYLVVWEDRRSGDDIYAARVTPAGTVLDPAGIAISTDADDEFEPTVAFDGTNFLAAWTDIGQNYGIFASRVSPAGAVLDPAGIRIAFDAEAPAVAFDGTNYLLAWQANEGSTFAIKGRRVTPGGSVARRVRHLGVRFPAGRAGDRVRRHQLPRRLERHPRPLGRLRLSRQSGGHCARPGRNPDRDRHQRPTVAGDRVRRHQLPRGVAGRS